MAYFMINGNDYSMYVNELKVTRNVNYNAQTNAAGNTVVDYIGAKRIIEVGIIPLNDAAMVALMGDIEAFGVSISFRNPVTGALEENVSCIIPSDGVEYYTIQANNVMYKAFSIEIKEL